MSEAAEILSFSRFIFHRWDFAKASEAKARCPSARRQWLFSRRADFWLASGGAALGLLAAILLILFHGDRELDAMDFVLSEFHLGATYDAIARRRLWQHRRFDVVIVPLVILALACLLMKNGHAILLTSITMYAAVWHRGRQSLGVARFYQRGAGGAVSRTHDLLFRGAIYLPMLAGMLAYFHLAPNEYEGNSYFSLSCSAGITTVVGFAAVAWVIAYIVWTFGGNPAAESVSTEQRAGLHPGERWVVLAHAIAFGSGYVLGATNASFLLVLAVHHEVQYLYFTYAMSRRSAGLHPAGIHATGKATSKQNERTFWAEARHLISFFTWPVIGFSGAIVGGWFQLEWLAALGVGGLLCHYWLDGRIWTRRGRGLA